MAFDIWKFHLLDLKQVSLSLFLTLSLSLSLSLSEIVNVVGE
jgi:hypothetical protein